MKIEVESIWIACAADDCMHAAQYLAGVSKQNYSDPAVWQSADPAIVMLRECYQFLVDLLDYLHDWRLNEPIRTR